MVKKIQLVIKCKTDDTPIAFKTLAIRIGEEYEETLLRLLELEKGHPLEKKMKGVVRRL
jgi:hypothetical protein